MRLIVITCFIILLFIGDISAAHFIVGRVNNAIDGASANGQIITLWNPLFGTNDNVTDIVGTSGNSGQDNTYLIDCELLGNGCNIGDQLYLRISTSPFSKNATVNVTGAGFDLVSNITLNSPPNVSLVVVDDSITSPANEIDLVTNSTRNVLCEYAVDEFDGDNLTTASARFFHSSSSFPSSDDNNNHYTNTSCFVNTSYGSENQSYITCGFRVEYYGNYGNWTCTGYAQDNLSAVGNYSDNTTINQLLSVGVTSTLNYGLVNQSYVSNEFTVNVTNYGNVNLNLSLRGYATSENDNRSMNCTLGTNKNISIGYEKYNLTSSNPGSLTLSQFESRYVNLTSSATTRNFNLTQRQNDAQSGIDDTKPSYWRIYVPPGVSGTCAGNVVFGATIN